MAEIVKKPKSVLPLGPVDISALLPLVKRVSERTWASEDANKENDFECFHHTRHIIFRFISANAHPEVFYSNPAWDAWKPLLLPVIQQAIVPYGFREPVFPKVMLARLEAGAEIDRHRDGAGSNLRTHKIHVPLITNADATFEAGGERVHLETGHAYEVNNIGLHAAFNKGDEDRIHLIFEVFEGRQEAAAAAE